MAWPHIFGNQVQANGSWLDDNFNAAAQLNTNVTFSGVSIEGTGFLDIQGGSDPYGFGATINYGASYSSSGLYIRHNGPTVGAFAIQCDIAAANSGIVNFLFSGTQVGSIGASGSTGVVYATTSDAALKVVHGPADGTGLSALPVRNCTFTAEGSGAAPHAMILAQECKAVAPYAVLEPPEGSDAPCMIDCSKLVAPLIAYAQALEARIAVLEAKALVTAPATSPGLIAARSALASAAALPVVQAAIARGVALKGVQNGITQAQTL